MTIKKFLIVSLAFHFLLFTGLYFVPEPKIKKAKEFVTNLVTPEELEKPEIRPLPVPKPLPELPPRPRVVPPPRRLPPQLPSRPPLPLETPVVPGEGKETGKPLPEGVPPKPSEGGKKGGEAKTGEKGTGERGNAVESAKPGYADRDALFDRKTIEEIARNDSGEKAGKGRPKKDDSITFDTEDYRYAGYMRNLRQKIESIWVYPPEAAAKGIYGDLKIRFTILKDGRLGAVELVRTSGYKMLDDAAIKALKDGQPYWPLPDSWKRDSYTIQGHFIYIYGGYYLR